MEVKETSQMQMGKMGTCSLKASFSSPSGFKGEVVGECMNPAGVALWESWRLTEHQGPQSMNLMMAALPLPSSALGAPFPITEAEGNTNIF